MTITIDDAVWEKFSKAAVLYKTTGEQLLDRLIQDTIRNNNYGSFVTWMIQNGYDVYQLNGYYDRYVEELGENADTYTKAEADVRRYLRNTACVSV